jgi:hypothetical protein
MTAMYYGRLFLEKYVNFGGELDTKAIDDILVQEIIDAAHSTALRNPKKTGE